MRRATWRSNFERSLRAAASSSICQAKFLLNLFERIGTASGCADIGEALFRDLRVFHVFEKFADGFKDVGGFTSAGALSQRMETRGELFRQFDGDGRHDFSFHAIQVLHFARWAWRGFAGGRFMIVREGQANGRGSGCSGRDGIIRDGIGGTSDGTGHGRASGKWTSGE
jgi:hypothetical protein